MKKIIAILTLIMSFIITPMTTSAEGPASLLVKNLFSDGLTIAKNEKLSEGERAQKLQFLLETYFDIETAQNFALGRYLKALTETQEKEYRALFAQYIVALYSPHIKKIAAEQEKTGSSLKILREEYQDEKNTLVASKFLRNEADTVDISWRIRKINGKQKIIDIIFEGGISMSSAIREQIVSTIHNKGVEELLKTLRDAIKKMSESS